MIIFSYSRGRIGKGTFRRKCKLISKGRRPFIENIIIHIYLRIKAIVGKENERPQISSKSPLRLCTCI